MSVREYRVSICDACLAGQGEMCDDPAFCRVGARDEVGCALVRARELLTPAHESHPDDAEVERFAQVMREKLAAKRREGAGGLDDRAACPPGVLQAQLLAHLEDGDPVDIGNYAMMLWARGECVDARSSLVDSDLSAELVAHLRSRIAACARHAKPGDDDCPLCVRSAALAARVNLACAPTDAGAERYAALIRRALDDCDCRRDVARAVRQDCDWCAEARRLVGPRP